MNWVAFFWVLLGVPAIIAIVWGAIITFVWANEKLHGWAPAIFALLIAATLVGLSA